MAIGTQLALFPSTSLNPTYEIKRQIRIALGDSSLSRDNVVDQMNQVAVREGMRRKISKATLDSWTKDSDPDRLPSPAWLTIFCHVMGTIRPIHAMARPLNAGVVGPDDERVLTWGRAELEKRAAAKRARLALEALEVKD